MADPQDSKTHVKRSQSCGFKPSPKSVDPEFVNFRIFSLNMIPHSSIIKMNFI